MEEVSAGHKWPRSFRLIWGTARGVEGSWASFNLNFCATSLGTSLDKLLALSEL
jgi:hypothetical protein